MTGSGRGGRVSPMIAVIAGATGLVGSTLVPKLLADRDIGNVISVGRKPLGLTHPKLIEVQIPDLAALPSVSAKLRGDLYFCCLGTTIKTAGSRANFKRVDYDAVVAFGEIARNHYAKSFTLVSATGANAKSKIFYNRVKGETESSLSELLLPSLTIFRPGLLVGDRKEVRPSEKRMIKLFGFFSEVLPQAVSKRVGTFVEVLADRMLEESRKPQPGVRTIPASEI